MAPKQAKAIFVDVHPPNEPDSVEAAEPDDAEPEPEPESEPEEPVVRKKRPEPPHLAAARQKALIAIQKRAEARRNEKSAVKELWADKERKRKEELDRLLAERKGEAPPPPTAAVTKEPALTPETKLFLKNKAQKYVQQAMLAMAFNQPQAPVAPASSPAQDVRMLARGRVQSYLTEQSMKEAMASIFPNGGY